MALIGVDFDHTLVEGDTPLKGAKEAINLLRENGHKIMIFSCNNVKWIEKVLNNADIRYDYIYGDSEMTKGKPLCDLYVDDRGYEFKGNWSEEVNTILEHHNVKGKDNRKW